MNHLRTNPQSEQSILALFVYIWQRKILVCAVPMGFGILTALWTLTQSNTYLSDTLLSPTEEAQGQGLSGLAGQIGGLASLTGLALPKEGVDNVTVAIAILRSRLFIKNFVEKYGLAAPLMAAEGWDRETGEVEYDLDIYNPKTGEWLREPRNGRPSEPTALKLYEQFMDILLIETDVNTGLVNISVEFYSPVLAREWLGALVKEVNEQMRELEMARAQKNVEFLTAQAEKTQNIDMRTIFFQLIEEQTKTLMLAEVREDFVFTTIDPPVVAELKHAPRRALICLFVVFITGFLTVLFYTIKFLLVPEHPKNT